MSNKNQDQNEMKYNYSQSPHGKGSIDTNLASNKRASNKSQKSDADKGGLAQPQRK